MDRAAVFALSAGLLAAAPAAFAGELSWWVDRVVTDRTALNGTLDLDLEWAPDVVPLTPSLFTSLREQLGLRLEPERGEVEVFVIERARRPEPN